MISRCIQHTDYNPYRYVREHKNGYNNNAYTYKYETVVCVCKHRVIAGDGHETRYKNKAIYASWCGMGWTVLAMTITCGKLGTDILYYNRYIGLL